jgi:hypothetical protein
MSFVRDIHCRATPPNSNDFLCVIKGPSRHQQLTGHEWGQSLGPKYANQQKSEREHENEKWQQVEHENEEIRSEGS